MGHLLMNEVFYGECVCECVELLSLFRKTKQKTKPLLPSSKITFPKSSYFFLAYRLLRLTHGFHTQYFSLWQRL